MRAQMKQPLDVPAAVRSRDVPPSIPTIGALRRGTWLLVAIVMSVVWFAALDIRKLQHPDEGRYAEIAREMLTTGDWITPRLNGLKYFEKPPLQYWFTAASYAAFEFDEWTARLPASIAGWLAVFVVGWAGTRLVSPVAGAYAAVALAGTVWHFGMAHILTVDSLLSFWLAVALCAFLVAQGAATTTRERRGLMLVAWAAIAGALLTKGLVALVIPAGSLVVYSLLTRDRGLWRRLELLPGMALALVLAAPWFIVVSLRNPEFARFFFVHEHFERYLTSQHHRIGAWWYFIPQLVLGLLPWIGIFAWTLRRSWRDAPRASNAFSWPRFCLVWAGFVFAFFSASGSKLPSYILPLFPPVALVLGWQLTLLPSRTLLRLAWPLAAGAWVLLVAAYALYDPLVARIADARTPVMVYGKLYPWLLLGLGVAAAGYSASAVAFRNADTAHRTWGVIGIALSTMMAVQLIFCANDAFRTTKSTQDLVTILQNESRPAYDASAPVYQVGMYDQTFPFYLERTATIVNFRDELDLGLRADPGKGIASEDEWISTWRRLPQAYALLAQDTLDRAAAHGLPYRVVARDPRRVLIARR
jgi:4-amino-4-deoxy-L-arabinose transferase-like glycosyltransferase